MAFADYLYDTAKSNKHETRINKVQNFDHFFSFLDAAKKRFNISVDDLTDLSTELIDDLYPKWLDGNKEIGSKIKITLITRNTRYKNVTGFITWARKSKKYKDSISRALTFKMSHWRGAHLDVTHHVALSVLEIAKVREACRIEIDRMLALLERTRKIFARPPLLTSTAIFDPSPSHFARDRDYCVKALHRAVASGKLDHIQMNLEMPGLARATRGTPHFDFGDLIEGLYFTPRTIVPFVILMGFHTAFNPTTILDLRWSMITKVLSADKTYRWRIEGIKDRGGGGSPVRTFRRDAEDAYGAVTLLVALRRHTTRLRPHVSKSDRDHVFIYWIERGKRPRSFMNLPRRTVTSTWYNNLKAFIKDNNLPRFGLANIRASAGSLASLMSEGDVEAQRIIQQHRSLRTTEESYQSEEAERLRAELLGEAMDQRQRFRDAGHRTFIQKEHAGDVRTAATPGFDCWDPRNSPIPGQKPGRLCSAYAKCPGCPLAAFRKTSPLSTARLLQVQQRLKEARARISPQRWAVEWQSQQEWIDNFWLPNVDATVITTARVVSLPPVPEIE